MKTALCITLLLAAGLLCACAPAAPSRPLSPVERADVAECREEAGQMSDSSNSNDPRWRNRFEFCMQQRGYTEADLRKLWY